MKLANKVIIITGASKGLGVSMAEECAREGARVVLAARSQTELDAVAEKIRSNGGEAVAVVTDMSRSDSVENLVRHGIAHFGRIDGLINNAGVNYVKPFLEIDQHEWQRVLDVDLTGSFQLTQLCARQMQKQGGEGSIVQIASVHTHASVAGAAPYDAAKMGMVGFSKAAAVELAPLGIRVNILSPGLCSTEIWKDIVAAAPSEKECLDYWNANIPGNRLIRPEEIAKCCVFLLSNDSSCITGANIFADLGMTSLLVSREPYGSKPITEATK
jgi:short-subunit dehydrogenase